MPATQLANTDLGNGWIIKELIKKEKGGTGGTFSHQYRVINDQGKEAFLKALDFSRAFQTPEPLRALQDALEEYHFEKDLYNKCKDKKMSRIVTPIIDGSVTPPVPSLLGDIYYIIFEKAEGDLRSSKVTKHFNNVAWVLRNLHQATVGLKQLHLCGIAHQDVKPSNILLFDIEGSKLTDLGRSSDKETPFKFDAYCHAGDMTYAPLEKCYNLPNSDFEDRFCTDLYLLGSLIFYYFLGIGLTPALITKMKMNPNITGNTFIEILPYLLHAFDEMIGELEIALRNCPADIKKGILELTKELCHPEPSKRGSRKFASKKMRLDLHRYISKFDLLATKASFKK